MRYFRTPSEYEAEKGYYSGRGVLLDEPAIGAIKALDPETGDVKWQYSISRSTSSGVLATAGGVVFAATHEGNVIVVFKNSISLKRLVEDSLVFG
jgi:outer membrane protein assembly factor BamB